MGPSRPPRGRAAGEGGAPDPKRPSQRRTAPPSWTPFRHPHSAQSQLARARAVGLVTGPHARTPPHPQPVGSGPRQDTQRAGSRGWESARPWTPHTQAGGAPPRHPHAAPTARKSARCGVSDGLHSCTPPHPQPVGSGPRQPAQRARSRRWESARPWTPHTQAGGSPPGALVPPPQRAKAARKSARCGVGDGSPRPQPPHPRPVGSGPRQPAQRLGSREWESARPRTPHT